MRFPERARGRTPLQRASERGAATVEHAGLSLLIALLLIAGIAALAAGSSESGRELGFTLARKLRCAAVGPGPCWRDPLTTAYGRPLGGAVRALAPPPEAEPSPSGPLLAVDFRTCRQASCAAPSPRPGLTASNRRVTAFTSVKDRRPATGTVAISYWHYRPTLGWEEHGVVATSADVARLASTPLLEDAVPTLVALETLDGRNHYEFPPGEQPPWRWRIESTAAPLP